MTQAHTQFRHTQSQQHATLIAAECMICGSLMASTSMRLLWFAEEQHVCPAPTPAKTPSRRRPA